MNYKPGVVLGGKYRIIEVLGGGAMGKLFKAEHISMHKPVAVKVMQGDFATNEEYQQRFMREARSAASLEHINICSMIDYDMTEDGDAYLVMELLSGETLGARIHRLGTLSPLSACLIMRQLMSALNCAHSKGIVHRDIKPDNIFLVPHEDRDDFVKLIDFGVAHIEHPDQLDVKPLTQSGQVYGTPQYISPEQANGEIIDYRADLYAAGIIFYEMLVGKPPIDGRSCLDLLINQVKEPPPHLPDTIANYQILDEIIQRLLQKKREDRYESAAEVMAVIDNAIALFTVEDPMVASSSLSAFTGSVSVNLQKTLASQNAASQSFSAKTHERLLASSKQKLYVIIALVFLLVGILIFLMIVILDKNAKAKKNEAANVEPQIVYIEKAVDTQETQAVDTTPLEYDIRDKHFSISIEPCFAAEPQMIKALEGYSQQEYHKAFIAIDSVKDKYWEHPNFLRLYLMCSAADDNHEAAFNAFSHLLAIEPLACYNPAVSEIANTFFEDSKLAESLGTVIIQNQGLHTKTAMSWLIIRSEYDSSDSRLNRMIDLFDRLGNIRDESGEINETPVWMIRSVNVWRLGKKECIRRQELLTQLSQMDEYRDDVYKNILIPLYNQNTKKCIKGRKSADCNGCLRPWLEKTVTDYVNGTAEP